MYKTAPQSPQRHIGLRIITYSGRLLLGISFSHVGLTFVGQLAMLLSDSPACARSPDGMTHHILDAAYIRYHRRMVTAILILYLRWLIFAAPSSVRL